MDLIPELLKGLRKILLYLWPLFKKDNHFMDKYIIMALTRENLAMVTLKPACSVTESSQNIEILREAGLEIKLCRE